MRFAARIFLSGVLVSLFVFIGFGQTAQPAADVVSLFEYDRTAPLDVKEVGTKDHKGAKVVELTYPSPKGGRVPALLVLPRKGTAKGAALYQHGRGEGVNKSNFLDEAAYLASEHKIAVLLIDAPFERPKPDQIPFGSIRDREVVIQNVIDWRRGIDLLEARPDVATERLAFVGHSYGGRIAGMMAGIDRRLDAVVVMATVADNVEWMRTTPEPAIAALRANAPKDDLEYYFKTIEPIEPKYFLPKAAPTRLLFQFGLKEEYISKKEMDATAKLASEPKEVRFYDAPHNLNTEATTDRVNWIVKELKRKK